MSAELKRFEPLIAEITALVAPVLTVKITDFHSSQGAINAAKLIKAMSGRLDDLRREAVDPLNAQVKAINEHVKGIKAPLDNADAYIRSELNRFAVEQEKIRQEELRKAEEERKRIEQELIAKQAEERAIQEAGLDMFGAGDDDSAAVELEKKQEIERAIVRSDFQQKSYDINQFQVKNTRKTWKCKVADITKVPKEFLIINVNESAALAAHKAGASIPGLEFYQEVSVAVGAKTRISKQALERE